MNISNEEIEQKLNLRRGMWSRIWFGYVHFPIDKLELFMELFGIFPLRWLAYSQGYDLVEKGKEAEYEKRVAWLIEENARLRKESERLKSEIEQVAAEFRNMFTPQRRAELIALMEAYPTRPI